jgi:hypothetical protein
MKNGSIPRVSFFENIDLPNKRNKSHDMLSLLMILYLVISSNGFGLLQFFTFNFGYHLPDVRKVIINFFTRILTSIFCHLNYFFEVFPFAISEQILQLTSTPTFHTF